MVDGLHGKKGDVMNNIRVIPKLDIKGPNVVKGLCFDGYRVLGKPEIFSEIYYREGADELFFQDVVASLYQRNNLLEIVKRTAQVAFIPLTVAGGIRSIDDIREILRAGADKVAINTAAIKNPNLLREASKVFGSQCIVSSIEAKRLDNGRYEVWVDYGREPTGVDVFDWARKVVDLGVGEIFLSSVDKDGSGEGYDLELVSTIASSVSVPVVACNGAGCKEDFIKVVKDGLADAVSAASIFHYKYAKPVDSIFMSFSEPRLRMGEQIDSGNIDFLKGGYGGFRDITVKPATILEVKRFMKESGIEVQIEPSMNENINNSIGFRHD